jgi:hypothetical protein
MQDVIYRGQTITPEEQVTIETDTAGPIVLSVIWVKTGELTSEARVIDQYGQDYTEQRLQYSGTRISLGLLVGDLVEAVVNGSETEL